MKTLVAFATKYGTTRSCAESIADRISGDVDVVDIKRNRAVSIEGYDSVVVGGPIYAGKVVGAVPAFCEKHREALLQRTVGLFICCLYEGETALSELDGAFPAWLNAHAVVRRAVGGAIEFSRLGAIDRYLARRVARIETDLWRVKDEELAAIAAAIDDQRTLSTRSPKTSGK